MLINTNYFIARKTIFYYFKARNECFVKCSSS